MSDTATREVETRAQSALLASPIYALHKLHVECEDGRMLLSGRVTTFYQKQLAQEAVRPFVEEFDLVNTIDVD